MNIQDLSDKMKNAILHLESGENIKTFASNISRRLVCVDRYPRFEMKFRVRDLYGVPITNCDASMLWCCQQVIGN